MKKTTLIISLLAAFALNVSAQSRTNVYGLKLGPTLNWVTTASDVGKNNGTRLGFGASIFVDHYFSHHLAVSSGLTYNTFGLKYQFADYRHVTDFLEATVIDVDRKYKGSCVELPVKLKVNFDVVDSWKAFAEGGVAIALNLTAKAKDEFNYYGITHSDTDYHDVSDQYRLFQFALRFGLGAEYELNSKLSVFAQLSYGHGLTNMFTGVLEKQTGSNLKSNFIGLEIGALY